MKAADKHFRSSCLKDELRPFLQCLLEWKVLSEDPLKAETFGTPIFWSVLDLI